MLRSCGGIVDLVLFRSTYIILYNKFFDFLVIDQDRTRLHLSLRPYCRQIRDRETLDLKNSQANG